MNTLAIKRVPSHPGLRELVRDIWILESDGILPSEVYDTSEQGWRDDLFGKGAGGRFPLSSLI